MRTDDFDFELPQKLIAQTPAPRGTSRLLVLDRASGALEHRDIGDLVEFMNPDDLLLLNDTRVIPARLYAHRTTGRKFELLLLREVEDDCWEALLRPSARARSGERLELADGGTAIPEDREAGLLEPTSGGMKNLSIATYPSGWTDRGPSPGRGLPDWSHLRL